jgi:hypothetical protein
MAGSLPRFRRVAPGLHPYLENRVNHLGNLLMLAVLASSVFDAVAIAPTAEDQRIGVYVLAGIFGLLVSGIVSCIKEMRNQTAERP